MKLKTLASAIVMASATLLTSCGSSDSDDTSTSYTYFDSLDAVTLSCDAATLDNYTYTIQITKIDCDMTTDADSNGGTEVGTCTINVNYKGDSNSDAIIYDATAVGYTYTADTGVLVISSFYINSATQEVASIELTVSKYNDTYAYVAPSSYSITIDGVVHRIEPQTMGITQN